MSPKTHHAAAVSSLQRRDYRFIDLGCARRCTRLGLHVLRNVERSSIARGARRRGGATRHRLSALLFWRTDCRASSGRSLYVLIAIARSSGDAIGRRRSNAAMSREVKSFFSVGFYVMNRAGAIRGVLADKTARADFIGRIADKIDIAAFAHINIYLRVARSVFARYRLAAQVRPAMPRHHVGITISRLTMPIRLRRRSLYRRRYQSADGGDVSLSPIEFINIADDRAGACWPRYRSI